MGVEFGSGDGGMGSSSTVSVPPRPAAKATTISSPAGSGPSHSFGIVRR